MRNLWNNLIISAGLFSCSAFAQPTTDVVGLLDGMASGDVELVSMNGNGDSTGLSVEGFLENKTEEEQIVSVYLERPLFLRNRNRSAQNMLATSIYRRGSGGNYGYQSDGKESFIVLGPRERVRVGFVAYCIDFDKENPSDSDSFDVEIGYLPEEIAGVANRIQEHEKKNLDGEDSVALQIALWLWQGGLIGEIAERFEFSDEDERLARKLISELRKQDN